MNCFIQSLKKCRFKIIIKFAVLITVCAWFFGAAMLMHKYCPQNKGATITAGICAFTIAEMLIVVGVVGTIAMMLMPGLIEGYKSAITTGSLKHAYATCANAFDLAVANNGTPDTWGLGSTGDQMALSHLNNIMAEQLKTVKNCGTGSGCFPDSQYKDFRGLENPIALDENTNYTKMILANGSSVALTSWDENCSIKWGDTLALSNVCGIVGVDVNGFSAPNQYGEDYFGFVITKYGLVPMGADSQMAYSADDYCNKYTTANTGHENGLSCTASVIAGKTKGNCGNGVGKGGADGSGLGNGKGNTCSENS